MSEETSSRTQPPRVARNIPTGKLDFEMITTDPAWGREVTPELYEKLKEIKGDEELKEEHLWGLLSMYTRDLRLGNLGKWQIDECTYYIDLASNFLRWGLVQSFMVSLSKAITRIELSQSHKGFLRKRTNTLTYENTKEEETTDKPKLLGGFKK